MPIDIDTLGSDDDSCTTLELDSSEDGDGQGKRQQRGGGGGERVGRAGEFGTLLENGGKMFLSALCAWEVVLEDVLEEWYV